MSTTRRFLLAITWLAALAGDAAATPPTSREVESMIAVGDPRAVGPIRERLAAALAAAARAKPDDVDALARLIAAIDDASLYGLDDAGPAVVVAYRAPALSPEARHRVLKSAARYRTPESEAFQRAALADPTVVEDFNRVPLLAALAERGDERAIDSLLAWTAAEIKVSERRRSASGPLLDVIPVLICPRFTERLRTMPVPAGMSPGGWGSYWPDLIDCHLPAAALIDRIERATTLSDVDEPLAMLARNASLDDLPRLRALTFDAIEFAPHRAACGPLRDEAAAAIRRRCWQAATHRPTE